MRVTNGMISNRVVFNMQRSLQRFFALETQMSSGRKINKPSDDPTGTQRDLNYRSELANIEQFQKNISLGLHWNASYDQVLSETSNFLTQAKEIAVAMSNDTYDEKARLASASQVQSIVDQVLSLANSKLEKRSMFAGHRTTITPFSTSANGVVYAGNNGDIEFEVDNGQRAAINLAGNDVFLKKLDDPGAFADIDIGLTGTTSLANLHAGDGLDQASGFVINDLNLSNSVTIDLSNPAIATVQDAIDEINVQLAGAVPPITEITARIGDEGNNLVLDTTASGLISVDTKLDRLNEGAGIITEPGSFRLYNDTGIDIEVDLSGATTVGEIITAFNNEMAASAPAHPELANVTMSLNGPPATSLRIDDTNGVPANLRIEDFASAPSIADQLGITGSIGASLIGQDLNPTVSFEVVENGGTTAADLGLLGSFHGDFPGSDLNPTLTVDDAIDSLRSGRGIDRGEIVMWQGERSDTIDLSDPTLVTIQDLLDRFNTSALDITASINADGTGIQITNNDPDRSFTIEDALGDSGAKDLGIYGSSDMMGTLFVLGNALRNNDRDGTGIVLGVLDTSIQNMLDVRGLVGSRVQRLETTESRLVDANLSFTRLLSEVEDADIAEVLTKLSTHEANYQSALMASAKIIQPSLLDFLRS